MGSVTPELSERINHLVTREFELDGTAITPDSDLYNDLGLDSLDAIDLVVALEKTFGFKVEEGAARKVRRMGQLYEFVAERVA
ncbi:MAG: acyl carrier protein [Planctomycetes bacterium]|nr:acyl carrier protein [Planctomycetota bacterium]